MITFNEYLANVTNQNSDNNHSLIDNITQEIDRIIENINETLENTVNSTDNQSRETSSAISFFRKLISSANSTNVANMSPENIKATGENALEKMKDFQRKFEAEHPEVAAKLTEEAQRDAHSLKAELPTTTESVMGMLGKGTAMIGAGLTWAAWKAVKFILLQILKVIMKIARNIFTTHGKGIIPFITISMAIIFPWLGFVQEPIFLIPAGIYYLVITIGTLLEIGE